MSPADVAAVIVLVLLGLVGLRLGAVRLVLVLASWSGAVAVTVYGFHHARPVVRGWIDNEPVADIAAGVGLFLASLVAFRLLSSLLVAGARERSSGLFDRLAGIAAGLALGALAVSGAYVASQQHLAMEDDSPFYADSLLLPAFHRGGEILLWLLPGEDAEAPEVLPEGGVVPGAGKAAPPDEALPLPDQPAAPSGEGPAPLDGPLAR